MPVIVPTSSADTATHGFAFVSAGAVVSLPNIAHWTARRELLRGRVHRMEAMIDGILEYSRAGRVREGAERVDTGALAREAADLLAPPPGVVVEVAPGMPVITTERLPLQQVFLNLVGNAVKHSGGQRGTVRVSAREDGEAWEFSVRDEGPGIPSGRDRQAFGTIALDAQGLLKSGLWCWASGAA